MRPDRTATLRGKMLYLGASTLFYGFGLAARAQEAAPKNTDTDTTIIEDIVAQGTYGLLNASLSIGTIDETWSLTGYIRNAFDERYVSQSLTSASDTVPARVGQLGAPSQYGVTLSYRF